MVQLLNGIHSYLAVKENEEAAKLTPTSFASDQIRRQQLGDPLFFIQRMLCRIDYVLTD